MNIYSAAFSYLQGDETKLYCKLADRTLALEYCDRALSIATELGIPLVKECQDLKQKLSTQEVI